MFAPPISLLASIVVLQSPGAAGIAAASPPPQVAAEGKADLTIGTREYRRIERRANEFTPSAQEAVALDLDVAGRAVVVWQSRRQEEGNYGVFARRFEADGTPISAEVHVNTTTESQQTQPAVAIDPSGAWFVWESFGQDGDLGSIVARRFDPTLTRASAEILVNEGFTEGHQEAPAIASDSAGNAILVWTTPGQAGGERWVFARRFDASAKPIGPAFRVDTAPGFRDSVPCVDINGANGAGGFVIAWARARAGVGPDAGKPAGIHARRFDAAGAAIEGEIEISPRDGRQHIEPALASGPDGNVAFAWFTSRGEEYGLAVRTAHATVGDAGGPGEFVLGPVREIEPGTPGYASGLAISRAHDGRLLLAWSGYGDEKRESDLFARLLRADGEPEGEVFRVPAVTKGQQMLQPASGARHVCFLDDGRMAFGWGGNADLGDSNAAHLTLLAPKGFRFGSLAPASAEKAGASPFAVPPEDSAKAAAPENHEPPTFRARDRLNRADYVNEESVAGPDYGFLGVVNTGWNPPDPHLSVGPGHIVLITNGAIQFMQKNGTLDFAQPIEGPAGFWGAQGATGFVFDPETCYDPHSGRFMAMACERQGAGSQSYFLFAVSDDSDPNGTWFKYRFNVTALAGSDIDSPELAVDSQAVYLCADFFTPVDKFLVFVVEKAPLLSGGFPITRSLVINGSQSYGVPVTYGTPPAQYMIEALEAPSNTQIRLHAIQNPLGTPTDTTVLLNVPAYEQPENPPQMGTTIRPVTFESRFWSCLYRNGHLWATHHTGTSRVLQRWYEIDMGNWPTSGSPTVIQQGDIDPGPGIRTFFGSIWADANDNAAMVFARSSPSEFISMGRTFRRATDPLGTMSPMVIVKPSTSPDTSQRWGDYSCVNDDPAAPGAFWGHAEFRTNSWMTWVDLFGPCDTPTQYCTAKLNSIGQLPFLSAMGEPSIGSNNFAVVVNNALPNKLGIGFYSNNPDSTPFAGGTRCVAPPLHRTGSFVTDGAGVGVLAQGVTLPLVGSVRYYQLFTRDPQIPDGTGLSLSNGLRVVFCP